jgi:hypothetical protein
MSADYFELWPVLCDSLPYFLIEKVKRVAQLLHAADDVVTERDELQVGEFGEIESGLADMNNHGLSFCRCLA